MRRSPPRTSLASYCSSVLSTPTRLRWQKAARRARTTNPYARALFPWGKDGVAGLARRWATLWGRCHREGAHAAGRVSGLGAGFVPQLPEVRGVLSKSKHDML